MTVVHRDMGATPEQVEAVLDDGYLYADWVVGTLLVREIDERWPAPGAHLRHRVGLPWLYFQGDSKITERHPGRLVLVARAHGIGAAQVDIKVERVGNGSRVTLDESVVSPRWARLFAPLVTPLVKLRNSESLRRLEALALAGAASEQNAHA